MKPKYKDNRIWKNVYDFVTNIYLLTANFPSNEGVTEQLRKFVLELCSSTIYLLDNPKNPTESSKYIFQNINKIDVLLNLSSDMDLFPVEKKNMLIENLNLIDTSIKKYIKYSESFHLNNFQKYKYVQYPR